MYITKPANKIKERIMIGLKILKKKKKKKKAAMIDNNKFEIVTSGGLKFDNEVVRVVKKMPKWIPALQNGINVPVNYLLPVTFIGVEE